MKSMQKTLNFKAEQTGDPGDRTFTATITTPALDRQDEVLLPEGLIATEYQLNPVVLFNHWSDKPIGRCLKLTRKPTSWEAVTKLAEKPEGHTGEWLPDVVYSLIKQGVINAVSVGFIVVERRSPTPKDYEKFGETVNSVISKWKLVEYSVAPTPCNQEALITAVKSFSVDTQKAFGIEPGKIPATATPPGPIGAVTITPTHAALQIIDASGDGTPQSNVTVTAPVGVLQPERKWVTLVIHTTRPPTEEQKAKALASGKLWL